MKSNIEWKFWGAHDPFYGVAAWSGREKDGEQPWTREDFYQLGESDWKDFQQAWQGYGVEPDQCIEIGCGAGRLTASMAGFFTRIDALDISAEMIACARENIDKTNISFHLVEGERIPLEDRSADAVFSTHVFQHFEERADAEQYFREIARTLKPGGSMMIHLPVFRWPEGTGIAMKVLYRATRQVSKLKAAIKRLAIRSGRNVHLMRMSSYESDWLFTLLPQMGFTRVEISVFTTRSNNYPHSFVFATRSDG